MPTYSGMLSLVDFLLIPLSLTESFTPVHSLTPHHHLNPMIRRTSLSVAAALSRATSAP